MAGFGTVVLAAVLAPGIQSFLEGAKAANGATVTIESSDPARPPPPGLTAAIEVAGDSLTMRFTTVKDGQTTVRDRVYTFVNRMGISADESVVEAITGGDERSKHDCSVLQSKDAAGQHLRLACFRPGEMTLGASKPMLEQTWTLGPAALTIAMRQTTYRAALAGKSTAHNEAWFTRFMSRIDGMKAMPMTAQVLVGEQWQLAPGTTPRVAAQGNELVVEYLRADAADRYALKLLPGWYSEVDPQLLFTQLDAPDGKARVCPMRSIKRKPFDLFEAFGAAVTCYTGLSQELVRQVEGQVIGGLVDPKGAVPDGRLQFQANEKRLMLLIEPGIAALGGQAVRVDTEGAGEP